MRTTLIKTSFVAVAIAATFAVGLAQKGAKPAAQKVNVTIDGGFQPSTVNVKVGKAVEITFTRKEKSGCGTAVTVPDLKFKRAVETGKSIVLKFTPKKAGTISFACGMGMYHGKIVVK